MAEGLGAGGISTVSGWSTAVADPAPRPGNASPSGSWPGSWAGIIGARRASICSRNCALAALSEPTHSGTLSAPRCLAALGRMRIVGLAS